MKKILYFLLALVIILPCLASCGKTTDPTKETTKETENATKEVTTEEVVKDDLPEKAMDGFELTILNYTDAAHGYSIKTMTVKEEDVGEDLISKEIFDRNNRVEERFDCYITEKQADRPYDDVRQNALVGTADYDVCLMYEEHIDRVLVAGALRLFEEIPYLDINKAYWNKDANDVYSVSGHQYAGVGDWCLTMYSKLYCYLMNKDVYKTQELDEDIYDLVFNKQWTIDKMYEIAAKYTYEADGQDGWTGGDHYGIAGTSKLHYQLLLTGCGLKFVTTNEDNEYQFGLMGETASNIMDKILNLNDHSYFNNNESHNGGVVATEFVGGQVLLLAGTVMNLSGLMKECKVGVIPAPMLDEHQDNYKSIAIGGLLTCFPTTLSKDRSENVGMIVEAMCSASYDSVVPAYKNVLLKLQKSDSEEDSKVMDILFETTTFDLGCSTWANQIRLSVMQNVFHIQNKNYSSFFTALSGTLTENFENTVNAILTRYSLYQIENLG